MNPSEKGSRSESMKLISSTYYAFSGWTRFRSSRGFILLVFVGLLAVLLALCVGFLSYTHGEVKSASTVRNKIDVQDIGDSALDWAIANICNDLLDSSNLFRAGGDGIVSNVRQSGDKSYRWWHRPFEPNMSSWINSYVSNPASWKVTKQAEAIWTYLPADFFPEGGVRGRFSVQIMDLNAFLHINDWLEDGNPTQCQMAHMFLDYYGVQKWNRHRNVRDQGVWGLPAGNFGISPSGYAGLTPLRYNEAWRVVTRTKRYTYWRTYDYDDIVDGLISPNWTTSNTVWMGLMSIETESMAPGIESDGIPLYYTVKPPVKFGTGSPRFYYPPIQSSGFSPGPLNWKWSSRPGGSSYCDNEPNSNYSLIKPYDGMPLSLWAYTDPDTGRSPINVNTCMHTGEKAPMNYWDGMAVFPISAVFNVESLRRIIKVGEFYFDHDNNSATPKVRAYGSAKTPPSIDDPDYIFGKDGAGKDRWAPVERRAALETLEDLRTKLAFQYQETLVRYFTATYAYNNIMPAIGSNGSRRFLPFSTINELNYYDAYKGPAPACGTTEAARVKHYVKTSTYSQTRFPCGLETFRQWVAEDLRAMSSNAHNTSYTGANLDGELTVGFDALDRPEIAQGKFDMRTANAVFDNIIPGKTWNDTGGQRRFLLFESDTRPGIRDPLWELYQARIGRDETQKEAFNVHHLYDLDSPTIVDLGLNHGDQHVWPKGRDVAAASADPGPYARVGDPVGSGDPPAPIEVPYRQLAFGPDWFSTELTTTSTTFIAVINAQLVDAVSVKKDPNNPLVLFWNQTGVVLEVAPDVMMETPSTCAGQRWPAGAKPDRSETGLGFYKGAWPKRIKTDLSSTSEYCMDKFSDGTLKKTHSENGDSYTAAREWIDPRGVEKGNEDSFYNGPNQTRKRVVIRTFWNLNQGIK